MQYRKPVSVTECLRQHTKVLIQLFSIQRSSEWSNPDYLSLIVLDSVVTHPLVWCCIAQNSHANRYTLHSLAEISGYRTMQHHIIIQLELCQTHLVLWIFLLNKLFSNQQKILLFTWAIFLSVFIWICSSFWCLKSTWRGALLCVLPFKMHNTTTTMR